MSDHPTTSDPGTDPGHAFLDLGERLRLRGQLDAALSVAQAGAGRFPQSAPAHDLIGRIRVDQGDDDGARSAWIAALECDASWLGALKGLAFLAFRRRDYAEAEYRLEAAAQQAPHDTTILAALDRVRSSRPALADDVLHFGDPAADLLLFDAQGLHLAGQVRDPERGDRSELVAAQAIGALHEAERAARLLDLGPVHHLLIEGGAERVVVAPVDQRGGVLLRRPLQAPAGRVVAMAERAVAAARAWLDR